MMSGCGDGLSRNLKIGLDWQVNTNVQKAGAYFCVNPCWVVAVIKILFVVKVVCWQRGLPCILCLVTSVSHFQDSLAFPLLLLTMMNLNLTMLEYA